MSTPTTKNDNSKNSSNDGPSKNGRLGGPGTAKETTAGTASPSRTMPPTSNTGGMTSASTGGPIMDSNNLELNKQKQERNMQFETFIKKLVKEEIFSLIKEETDNSKKNEEKNDELVEFGTKVDEFINDVIEKANKLHEEGQSILFDEDLVTTNRGEKYRFLSSRLGFLKHLKYKLAQRYEGLRKEI